MNLNEMRRALHLAWVQHRGVRETFMHGHTDNSYWFKTGAPWAEVNVATFYEKDLAQLEHDLKIFWDAKQIHMVHLGGAALDMADVLVSRGYVQDDIMPLMVYSITDEDSKFQLREGLELRKVVTDEDLDGAAEVLSKGFEFELEMALKGVRFGHGREEVVRYLLLDKGVPVSSALISKSGDASACFEVATPPEYQKKGYGAQIMKSVIAQRALLGEKLMLLQASVAGNPLYIKVGFEVIDYTQGWSIHDAEKLA